MLLAPHHFHAEKDPASRVDVNSEPCFMILRLFLLDSDAPILPSAPVPYTVR